MSDLQPAELGSTPPIILATKVLVYSSIVTAAKAAADANACLKVCSIPKNLAILLADGIALESLCRALLQQQPVPTVTVTRTAAAQTVTALGTTRSVTTTVTATSIQSASTVVVTASTTIVSVNTTTLPAATIVSFNTTTLPGTTIITTAAPLTTTITSVSTTSVSACPSSTSSQCSNAGLQYAAWGDPYGQGGLLYPGYDPTYMKSTSVPGGQGQKYLLNSGNTTTIGVPPYESGRVSPYGGPSIASEYVALSHRGYLYTKLAGVYTFEVGYANELALVWTGQTAVQGWTRSNAIGAAGSNGATIKTAALAVGQYVPIRVIWANAQGSGGLVINIRDPSGAIIFNGTTSSPGSVVRYSCDGTSAPGFSQAFGAET